MVNKEKKYIGFYAPISLYISVKRWANEIDSDISKVCRQALEKCCNERGIDIEKEYKKYLEITQGDDKLARALIDAGIGLEELRTDEDA